MLEFPKIERYCPFCEQHSVLAIDDHWSIGRCSICNHVRQIPVFNSFNDPLYPPDLKFLIGIINTCRYPKPKKLLVFNGNIRSQGKYY